MKGEYFVPFFYPNIFALCHGAKMGQTTFAITNSSSLF